MRGPTTPAGHITYLRGSLSTFGDTQGIFVQTHPSHPRIGGFKFGYYDDEVNEALRQSMPKLFVPFWAPNSRPPTDNAYNHFKYIKHIILTQAWPRLRGWNIGDKKVSKLLVKFWRENIVYAYRVYNHWPLSNARLVSEIKHNIHKLHWPKL